MAAMLIGTPLKTGATLPGSRDGFVVRKVAKGLRGPESLRVRAATSESGGWFGSKAVKVGSSVEEGKLHGRSHEAGSEMVRYKGTAVIIKKLKVLDVVDRIADVQDDASEVLGGKHVSVQLVSNEIDPRTGLALLSAAVDIEGWVTIFDPFTAQEITFHLDFAVPRSFGVPGAVIVRNNHPNEFCLVRFSLGLPDNSSAHFIANSWVYNTEHTDGRVFFRNKAYLPSETPASLRELREKELHDLRGNGKGERKQHERIYDYDVYNDLGLPDDGPQHARPTLGGNAEFPFPRRMRTGRPPTATNPECESRKTKPFYVPSDERFDHVKLSDNKADMVRAGGHAVSSKIEAKLMKKADFKSMEDVRNLYAPKGKDVGGINNVLPGKADVDKRDQHPLVFLQELTARRADGEKNNPLRFPLPQCVQANDKAWQTDAEFAREFLAGFNSIEIKLATEFPLKSELNPAEYGNPVSAISSEHIDGHLEGLSIQEAVSKKKLFVVDYHDTFLPWVGKINALENSKTYASRTLFFLSSDETLKVLAIELVLPPKTPGVGKTSRVLKPPTSSSKTDHFVWKLAKAHAINNEMAVHQSISHFTRCHAVTEPMIIASHRQLSKLHPIHQLMAPHLKHTLEVNSTARMNLLPAGGTIEEIYTPREYIVPMAAVFYRDHWTFSSNALPNDLVRRGMAVPDTSAKHGVRLVIQDYPYAADGLELWSAMKSWNTEYIDIFYKDDGAVQDDVELQRWWTEYRTVGHADRKDAPGWPALDSKKELAEILTTLQWIPTAMHAPINFGQYDYAGFMPKNPAVTRRLIPEEGTKEWEEFERDPEKFYFSTISDTDTTTTAMAVFEVVAAHAPNEEYIGQRSGTWTENEKVKGAFKRYAEKLSDIDELIQARNRDKNLKNRCGVAEFPFQLLRPTSKPGVTGMGVPNSITV